MRNGLGSTKRWLIGGVAATVATVGIVVVTAAPASADPVTTYVAAGSDTTQDVMNGIAGAIGGGHLGSWDATNPGTPGVGGDVINPKAGCSMTRPNGSTQGLNALRRSINENTAAAQLANPPELGCVDVARSSSAPGGNANPNGQLIYIPFALDAVGPATGGTTSIAQANNFSQANLVTLHACNQVTVNGVTYDPNIPPAGGTQPIHLYIPQPGSGTRTFWAGQVGIPNPNSLPPCVRDQSVVTPGLLVQEHDGTVLEGDPAGLGPYSIAQWIAQSNGFNDRRHGAVLRNLNGVSPFANPPPAPPTLNTAFPITREVYSVMKLSRVTPGSADFDAGLRAIFVSTTGPFQPSVLCTQPGVISQLGFGLLTATSAHRCGVIDAALRAFLTV